MKKLLNLIFLLACLAPVCAFADSYCTPVYNSGLCFSTINDQVDNNPPNTATPETFTQWLGINNSNQVVGYYGSGTLPDHPNKGVTFTYPNQPLPPITFTKQNFPGSAQTQLVGINNLPDPTTVGFWINSAGANFGFADVHGTYTTVVDPATTGGVNQLLGVNNSNIAAGFYTDSAGNNHAYLFNIGTSTFTALTLPAGFNAVSVTATDVNNNGLVSGFYTDTSGNTHGFLDNAGHFTSYNDPGGNGTNTMFLGLNNLGEVVGSYVDSAGVTNGLLINEYGTWITVDDPFQSPTPEFGVTGTTVNGINDAGYLVGFFSNGVNGVDGFVATPEPASLGLLGLALFAAGLCSWRRLSRASHDIADF